MRAGKLRQMALLCRSSGLHAIKKFMWQQEDRIPFTSVLQVCISVAKKNHSVECTFNLLCALALLHVLTPSRFQIIFLSCYRCCCCCYIHLTVLLFLPLPSHPSFKVLGLACIILSVPPFHAYYSLARKYRLRENDRPQITL